MNNSHSETSCFNKIYILYILHGFRVMTWISYTLDELLLNFNVSLLQDQVFAHYSFPDILNVFHDCLKV